MNLLALKEYRLSLTLKMPNHLHLKLSSVCVCVEILQLSQPNGVMSSLVSLPNHTFTGQSWFSKRLTTSIVHILSPETVNCPSWISGRERTTVENISWSISTKECCRPQRSRTHDLLVSSRTRIQLSHWGRPVIYLCHLLNILANFPNLFLHIGKQCGPWPDCS